MSRALPSRSRERKVVSVARTFGLSLLGALGLVATSVCALGCSYCGSFVRSAHVGTRAVAVDDGDDVALLDRRSGRVLRRYDTQFPSLLVGTTLILRNSVSIYAVDTSTERWFWRHSLDQYADLSTCGQTVLIRFFQSAQVLDPTNGDIVLRTPVRVECVAELLVDARRDAVTVWHPKHPATHWTVGFAGAGQLSAVTAFGPYVALTLERSAPMVGTKVVALAISDGALVWTRELSRGAWLTSAGNVLILRDGYETIGLGFDGAELWRQSFGWSEPVDAVVGKTAGARIGLSLRGRLSALDPHTGRLSALDPETGRTLWSVVEEGVPVDWDDSLAVYREDSGRYRGVELPSGKTLWAFEGEDFTHPNAHPVCGDIGD